MLYRLIEQKPTCSASVLVFRQHFCISSFKKMKNIEQCTHTVRVLKPPLKCKAKNKSANNDFARLTVNSEHIAEL